MRSRVASALLFLFSVLVWTLVTLSFEHTRVLVDAQSSEIDSESFQYLEQWGDKTPFRWSNRTISLPMPPTLATYTIVDLSLVGHQPHQTFRVELQHQQSQTIDITTYEQRFRQYQVLFARTPEWIPTLRPAQLIIQTPTTPVENRALGIGVHHIRSSEVGMFGGAFWWEFAWVTLTLFVCSIAISATWHGLRGLISVFTCVGLMLAYHSAVPLIYIRILELGIIGVFLNYRLLPTFTHQWIQLAHTWLMYTAQPSHSLGQRIAQQWFVAVGLSGVGAALLWWARHNDSAEWWDVALYLLVGIISTVSTAWALLRPSASNSAGQHTISKRTRIGIIAVLSGWFFILFFGFQNETLRPNAIPRFVGFDVWLLMILIVVAIVFPRLMNKPITTWQSWVMAVLALYVVVVGVVTIFGANDVLHNLYVVNEMLTPAVGKLAFHDFIPQYSTLLNGVVWLISQWTSANNAVEIINFGVYSIMLTTALLAVMLVVIVYQSMTHQSYTQAILLALPPLFMSSFPVWNRIIASTPSADFYSVVPFRLFSIVVPYIVAISLLLKWREELQPRHVWYLGAISGLIIFNNNDFGLMASFALGIMLLGNPYIARWQARLLMGVSYCVGIVTTFVVIIASYAVVGKSLNTEFLFWFSRQFSGGFGALMIALPGPGTLVITTAVALCVVSVLSVVWNNSQREWLCAHPLRSRNYLQLIYFAVVATIGLLYYLNRSSARALGISIIPLSLAFVALWMLIQLHATYTHRITTYAVRCAALLPVALVFGYTLVPTTLPTPLRFSDAIMAQRASDLMNTTTHSDVRSTWPFETTRQTADVLTHAGLRVGYFGPFPHITQIYTDVPARLIFNHPHDIIISSTTRDVLCSTVFDDTIDVVIVAEASIEQNSFCDSYPLYQSPLFPATIAVNPELRSAEPDRFNTIHQQLQLCRSQDQECQFHP